MSRGSPVPRVAWGLVVLTAALLLTLDLFGVFPKSEAPWAAARIETAERIARQAARAAQENALRALAAELEVAARRDETLESLGLRAVDGRMLMATRDHQQRWEQETRDEAQQLVVPIRRGGEPWAELELRFGPPPVTSRLAVIWQMPVVRLIALLGASSFFVYVIYLRRILKHLDPSAVVPPRVRAALDVMAEGVVLIDDEGRIALANEAFCRDVDATASQLLGRPLDALHWEVPIGELPEDVFPWRSVLARSATVVGKTLRLEGKDDAGHIYNVNSAPVLDGWGKPKGAIVTFDDVSELEARNQELERLIDELERSHEEIESKAEQLELLARRDALTGVSNRRAFMDFAERHRQRAQASHTALSCLMVDIDFFKRVNDTHGHAAGDAVIQSVARALSSTVRSSDLVCRYGGEEFCVLLPSASLDEARQVAERMRQLIDTPGFAQFPVTASLGVSRLREPAQSLAELIDEADQALYASKRRGRNRVTCFGEHEDDDAGPTTDAEART